MKNLVAIILAYIVLVICMLAMYFILLWMGNAAPNVRDTVLAVGGGIFGGIAFKYFDLAILHK